MLLQLALALTAGAALAPARSAAPPVAVALPTRPASVRPTADTTRVRVVLDSAGTVEGTLLQARSDSAIVVGRDGTELTIPVRQIARAEIAAGRESNGRRGMLWGALLGGAAGAIEGGAGYRACTGECWFTPTSRGAAAVGGGVVGALGGLVVGGVVGLFVHTPRWEPIRPGALPKRAELRVVPGAASVAIRF